MSLDQILLLPGLSTGGPSGPALLQEQGGYFLLEDGLGFLLME